MSGRVRSAALGALLAVVCVCGCARQSSNPNQNAAAAGAAPPPMASDSNEPSRPRVVALGDSLTAGFGLLVTQAYPHQLQQKIDNEGYKFEVVNAGVSGDTSAGALRRLDWALEGDVKVLIIALGGNDGLRGLSIEEMKRNIGEMIDRARERKIVVIVAGMEAPPNYGPEYATSFRRAFQDVARERRVLLIPFLLSGVAGNADLNQSDGIHPNPRGAAIVSDTVWSALKPVLDQMSTTQ
jgi:acyl-CoA thioesterase-1